MVVIFYLFVRLLCVFECRYSWRDAQCGGGAGSGPEQKEPRTRDSWPWSKE